jgi:hypothetical protein
MQMIGENHDSIDEEGVFKAGLMERRAQVRNVPDQQVVAPSRG